MNKSFGVRILLSVLLLVLIGSVIVCQRNKKPTGTNLPPATNNGDVSAVLGPQGGRIEIADTSNPLSGTIVEIPEGALTQETKITVGKFLKTDLEGRIGKLPKDMRFFGGIRIEASGASLKKAMTISLPNRFGATTQDQLLVGRVFDAYGMSCSLLVYTCPTQVGSPIDFQASSFGAFGILSPLNPLILATGSFVDQQGRAVAGGLISTSHSRPFVALTDGIGHFEIPAGPPATQIVVMGIPPAERTPAPPTPSRGVGIQGYDLPAIPPTFPNLFELIKPIVLDELGLPSPPPPLCTCDPNLPFLIDFSSIEDPEPPFELKVGQTVQTFMFSPYGIFSGLVPERDVFIQEMIVNLYTLTIAGQCSWTIASSVQFSIDDSKIARVDENTGVLTALSDGKTKIHGIVSIAKIQCCPGYPPFVLCLYTQAAEATVDVSSGNGVKEKWTMWMKDFTDICYCGGNTTSQYFSSAQLGWIIVQVSGNSFFGVDEEDGDVLSGTANRDSVRFTYVRASGDIYEMWNVVGTRTGNTILGSFGFEATYGGLLGCNYIFEPSFESENKNCSGSGKFEVYISSAGDTL